MTSSPLNFKKTSPIQKVDLPKIDKLLDKLQRNIHKCQDDEYYEETEKYVSHIEKTSELCSLVWQEIIGTFEMSANDQCIKTFGKLFKVMRLQTISTLNFGLHYYKQCSEGLADREKSDSTSPKAHNINTIADLEPQSPHKPHGISYESRFNMNETLENIDGRASVFSSSSPANRRQPYHRGPNYPVYKVNGQLNGGKSVTMAPVLSSQGKSLTNFKYTFGAQLNKTDREISPEMLTVSDNRHNQLNSMQEMLENMPTEEEDQNMLKEYNVEHDKMLQQIDEVLKGKTKVANLTPNNITLNLRQVLRNLETTHKEVNQMTDPKNNYDDDDSDDMEEPNFAAMGHKIKDAFQQAKLKAVSNMKGVLKNNSPTIVKKKGEPVGKGKANVKGKPSKGSDQILIVKKDVTTMCDELDFIMEEQALLSNENNSQPQKGGDEKEEKNKLLINILKIKIGQLEKEKSDRGEKYTKLINDYSQCAQEKRDAWERIKLLEKEIEELKQLLKQQQKANNHETAKIPIAHTHDHSERSPVTALQFNNIDIDPRDEVFPSKGTNQEWDHVRGGASEIFSNSAKHEANLTPRDHGSQKGSSNATSKHPSVQNINDKTKPVPAQETVSHNNIEHTKNTSPERVVKERVPSKSLHSSTVQSNFKTYQSNHESPVNKGDASINQVNKESNISENQKRNMERVIDNPSYKLEDLHEDISAEVGSPTRPVFIQGDNDHYESKQTLSIEEKSSEIEPEKPITAALILEPEAEAEVEKKKELVNTIKELMGQVGVKAQEVIENNPGVSLGLKSASHSQLQTPSNMTSPTQQANSRKKIDVRVKTEIDRSKKTSPDRRPTNNNENTGKKAISINNFEKAHHVKPSNQKPSRLVPPQTNIVDKSQESEANSPGIVSVDDESNTQRAKKFINEGDVFEQKPIRERRREKSLADCTPGKLSILQSFDFQEDLPMEKLESPSKGRTLVKRKTDLQMSRPGNITTEQPSRIAKPRESTMKSPTENLRRVLEGDDSMSYTSPNLNNSNESNNNSNVTGVPRTLGKSSTLVYLRTADSPTHHQARAKPGMTLQSNTSLVNINSISKTNIKSPTYIQEFVTSKTPSIAKKIWQEVEEVKNFPTNGILYKGRSKFPTSVPMTYDSAEDRGNAESSPNRYMYSTSRGLEDEVIGNNEARAFPITISNYSPKNSHLQDFSNGFNTTSDKFMKTKLTIEECLRLEMKKEKESPAGNQQDGQIRIMYRSMLSKARQDPKLIQYLRRLVEIEGLDLSSSEHPIVEYDLFARFVRKYVEFHERCGENCEHVLKFYSKMGYQVFWNKRAPMPIKKAEIGVRANDTGRNSPRFPSIGKKKKEVGRDIYH